MVPVEVERDRLTCCGVAEGTNLSVDMDFIGIKTPLERFRIHLHSIQVGRLITGRKNQALLLGRKVAAEFVPEKV